MADAPSCACKGIRSCLICENNPPATDISIEKSDTVTVTVYTYCALCCSAFEESESQHPNHQGKSIPFHGISIIPDFVSQDEERDLLTNIYKSPFVPSQSGRRKQDFGPKVNFKKKKLRADKFTGLPGYSKFLYDRMQNLGNLSDFLPVELCNLEYSSDRGASIDPHFDDFWLWGERLVTLNLVSDSVLTFTCESLPAVEVGVPLLLRSLIVVSGDARNVWKHGIHREHISGERMAITLRELTPQFLDGGQRAVEGKSLLDIALTFEGVSVAES